MDNFLNNGTVLPFGLLGQNDSDMMAGFNKSYRNTPLRMGIVIKAYVISDPGNLTGLTTEYDVFVFEQNEDKGSTIIKYKNCLSSEGLGSIADYFEKTLRVRGNLVQQGSPLIDTKGQNGAVVLLLCLDGMSDKAIIMSGLTHPDRQTNLVNDQPYLEGEYNGVNVVVANDGSAKFTFNGATDNDGNIIDDSQGPTVAQIEKDGSFQIDHSTITFRLDRNGTATLTTDKDLDLNITGDVNVNAQGDATVSCANANILAQQNATVDGKSVLLGKDAAEAVIKGNTFKSMYDSHTHSNGNMGSPTGPPMSPMDPSALSSKVETE
jgi:hypothetical protein